MTSRKLIEAALPLDAINEACLADKDRKVGTIRNVAKWFAPMPPPAWRALLFATLVDDPEEESDRDDLLRLIEQMMATGPDPPGPDVLRRARATIAKAWPEGLPEVMDPFCGGGSTLIEAQRLGLPTRATDLNPVPALITRALTELLPAVRAPDGDMKVGAQDGLVYIKRELERLGGTISKRVAEQLQPLYGGSVQGKTVAWLWCRTVRCGNPACGRETPLASTWIVSKRPGQEHHLVPIVEATRVRLEVRPGLPPAGRASPKRGRGAVFECSACEATLSEPYIREQGLNSRLGLRMTVVIEEGPGKGRVYRNPTDVDIAQANGTVIDPDVPDVKLPLIARWFSPPFFGYTRFSDLHTPRQLQMLAAFSDAIAEHYAEALETGEDEHRARTVATMLGLALGKLAQASSSIVRWNTAVTGSPKAEPAFARHDVAMQWDFAETNPWGGSVGDFQQCVSTMLRALPYVVPGAHGVAGLADARSAVPDDEKPRLIATDPPYFNQIGYADLSDYFYLWHRRALRRVHPDLYATMSAPKSGELIALAERHDGDREAAKAYFVEGFSETFRQLGSATVSGDLPMLVVYAFKEQSTRDSTGVPPGWEAILEAIVGADLTITGTWPIRGARAARMVGVNTNSLATYVVLVCRPREPNAGRITKSDLVRELRRDLEDAVVELQHANIAPVDLAQAVIGPGMRVYSQYARVVEPDGSRVGVKAALGLINRSLAEVLDEQEGELDDPSRWAVTWHEERGFDPGEFGRADQLARAKGIAVDALVRAGIVESGASKVTLIARGALPEDWDPQSDSHPTAWEAVQHLVRRLESDGELGAAALYRRLGKLAEPARELTYRLFQVAERRGAREDAIAYNALVSSWSEISRLADTSPANPATETLF